MGLRACIAIELVTGASLACALATGAYFASAALETQLAGEALAATRVPRSSSLPIPPRPEPPTELNLVVEEPMGMFLGVSDDVLLAPLQESSPITQVKFNKGGSSISLRIDFENGARAAFKPRQTNWQSVPRREVVAYRLNRLLGLSSVPPAVGGRFKESELLEALHPSQAFYKPRLEAEMIDDQGWVIGELSWWIPVIERGRIGGFELDSMEGIVSWKRQLTVGSEIPEEDRKLVAQISDMVLFDFIINNPDRWSGGNARVSEDDSVLFFMDNTMSFGDDMDGHPKARVYFQRCQKFSRALVERLRELKRSDVREVLEVDVAPFDFYLHGVEIKALLSRRDLALEYIDDLIRQYGEDQVLAFP